MPDGNKGETVVPSRALLVNRRVATIRGGEVSMPDPKPGERIPGTDYFRCDHNCLLRKLGGGSEKRHCISDPDDQCTPNDPKDEYRCHCQPWRRKHNPPNSPWEPVPQDENGNFDLPDPDEFKTVCWCVRKKRNTSTTVERRSTY